VHRELVLRAVTRAICLCFFVITFASTSSAQQEARSDCVDADSASGFFGVTVNNDKPVIVSRFQAGPVNSASPEEARSHFAHEIVLSQILATELTSIDESCQLMSGVDSTSEMHFGAFPFITTKVDGAAVSFVTKPQSACQLRHCAQILSTILRDDLPTKSNFDETIKNIVANIEDRNKIYPDVPSLGLERAKIEAYRSLYSAGSPERIRADLSADDYFALRFNEFSEWYKRFLTQAKQTKGTSSGAAVQPACTPEHPATIKQLEIRVAERDHEAILLIDRTYTFDGPAGIANDELRALCHPHDHPHDGQSVSFLPPRLKNGVLCARSYIGSDYWLIVHSTRPPVATASEMMNIAEGIAKALGEKSCSRIILVKFVKQD